MSRAAPTTQRELVLCDAIVSIRFDIVQLTQTDSPKREVQAECEMRRVVVVSTFYPSFRRSGSAARLAQLLSILRDKGAFVHLVFMRFRRPPLTPASDSEQFVDQVSVLDLRGETFSDSVVPLDLKEAAKPYGCLNGMLQRLRGKVFPAKLRLATIVEAEAPDVLIIDHTFLAPLIMAMPRCKKTLYVLDTHDVLHRRDKSFAQAGLEIETGVSCAEETKMLEPFDVVIAIQDREREILQEMLPQKRVVTIEHACKLSPQSCENSSIRFIGSDYFANVQGFLRFLHEAWPLVRARCPHTQLEVGGGLSRNPTLQELAARDHTIVLRDATPRVSDLYDGPAAMVCPLWAGSGLKIKMVESLAHGKATVASPIAAEGLEDGCDRAYALATTPRDFVEPIVSIVSNPQERKRWENNAVEYAATKFDPKRVGQKLWDTLFQAT